MCLQTHKINKSVVDKITKFTIVLVTNLELQIWICDPSLGYFKTGYAKLFWILKKPSARFTQISFQWLKEVVILKFKLGLIFVCPVDFSI
jgi:hypothetical protein